MTAKSKYMLAAGVVIAVGLAVIGVCLRGGQPKRATNEQRAAVTKALDWLRTQQQEDGSFNAGFGHPAGVTCDAALAVVASGGDPATWRAAAGRPSIVDYLTAHGDEYATDAATTGKLILTLSAAGLDLRNLPSHNWIAELQSLSNGSGTYDAGSIGQAWAILALVAAGEPVPADTLAVLKGYQLESGAWSSPFGVDNDTTCYALQALIAAGESKDSSGVRKALAFLQSQQNDDGGFPAIKPSEWGTDTNANSTASVIMALTAAGDNAQGVEWTKSGHNPIGALLSLQAGDGKVEFQPGVGSPLVATAQAIPALLGKSLAVPVGR